MSLTYLSYVGILVLAYTITLAFYLWYRPELLPNVFGFLALICFALTLMPSLIRIVFQRGKGSKLTTKLMQYRAHLGVTAFSFAMTHGLLLTYAHNIDFLARQTYRIYFLGLSSFTIFTLLTLTTNTYSIKRLKKSWKRLHKATYALILLLPLHILDKMRGHWTLITPVALGITLSLSLLFLIRLWLHRSASVSKATPTSLTKV